MKQLKTLSILIILSCISYNVHAIDSSAYKELIVAKHQLSKTSDWKKYIFYIDMLFDKVWNDEKKLKKFEKRISVLKDEKNYNIIDKKTQNIIDYLDGKIQKKLSQITKTQVITELETKINTNLSCTDLLTEEWKDILNETFHRHLSISEWCDLEALDISDIRLTQIPKEIWNLINLASLNLGWNNLTQIPKEIWNLINLTSLNLHYNELTNIPKEIWNLVNLTSLHLGYNELTNIPKEAWNLVNLASLDLRENKLTNIPKEIWNLITLESLYLVWNKIVSVPSEIWNLLNLISLDLHNNELTQIPKEFSNLKNLTHMNLQSNDWILPLDSLYNIYDTNIKNNWTLEIKHNPYTKKIEINILK
jgi:Leucine-rich repeat (LRR) protein